MSTTHRRAMRQYTWDEEQAVTPVQAGAAASVLVAGIALAWVLYTTGGPTPITDNLCPVGGVGRHVVVLVDQSDAMSPDQQRTMETTLREFIARLHTGDRITLFKLSASGETFAEQLIDVCRPKPRAEANANVENPRDVAKTYSEQYEAKLQGALGKLRPKVGSEPASPLIEAFHAIAHSANVMSPARERQLIAFSDLLQKSETADFYQGAPYTVPGLGNSAYLDAPMEGVAVTLYQLKSPKHLARQAQALAFFKELFAKTTGGLQPTVRSL